MAIISHTRYSTVPHCIFRNYVTMLIVFMIVTILSCHVYALFDMHQSVEIEMKSLDNCQYSIKFYNPSPGVQFHARIEHYNLDYFTNASPIVGEPDGGLTSVDIPGDSTKDPHLDIVLSSLCFRPDVTSRASITIRYCLERTMYGKFSTLPHCTDPQTDAVIVILDLTSIFASYGCDTCTKSISTTLPQLHWTVGDMRIPTAISSVPTYIWQDSLTINPYNDDTHLLSMSLDGTSNSDIPFSTTDYTLTRPWPDIIKHFNNLSDGDHDSLIEQFQKDQNYNIIVAARVNDEQGYDNTPFLTIKYPPIRFIDVCDAVQYHNTSEDSNRVCPTTDSTNDTSLTRNKGLPIDSAILQALFNSSSCYDNHYSKKYYCTLPLNFKYDETSSNRYKCTYRPIVPDNPANGFIPCDVWLKESITYDTIPYCDNVKDTNYQQTASDVDIFASTQLIDRVQSFPSTPLVAYPEIYCRLFYLICDDDNEGCLMPSPLPELTFQLMVIDGSQLKQTTSNTFGVVFFIQSDTENALNLQLGLEIIVNRDPYSWLVDYGSSPQLISRCDYYNSSMLCDKDKNDGNIPACVEDHIQTDLKMLPQNRIYQCPCVSPTDYYVNIHDQQRCVDSTGRFDINIESVPITSSSPQNTLHNDYTGDWGSGTITISGTGKSVPQLKYTNFNYPSNYDSQYTTSTIQFYHSDTLLVRDISQGQIIFNLYDYIQEQDILRDTQTVMNFEIRVYQSIQSDLVPWYVNRPHVSQLVAKRTFQVLLEPIEYISCSYDCSKIRGGAYCDTVSETCQCNDLVTSWYPRTHCVVGCPCLNGGVCRYPEDPYGTFLDGLEYYCQCPTGFQGPLCQLKQQEINQPTKSCHVSDFLPDVCLMGTIECKNDNDDKPQCTCADFWTTSSDTASQNNGIYCNQCLLNDPTYDDRCNEEGTHKVSYTRERCGSGKCVCKKGWTGHRCTDKAVYTDITFIPPTAGSSSSTPIVIDDYRTALITEMQAKLFSSVPAISQLTARQLQDYMRVYNTSIQYDENDTNNSTQQPMVVSYKMTFIFNPSAIARAINDANQGKNQSNDNESDNVSEYNIVSLLHNSAYYSTLQTKSPEDIVNDLYSQWNDVVDNIGSDITSVLGSPSQTDSPIYQTDQCDDSTQQQPIQGCPTNTSYRDDDYTDEYNQSDALDMWANPISRKNSTASSSQVGMIIGIIIGVVVLFIIMLILLLCFKKKKMVCFAEKKKRKKRRGGDGMANDGTTTTGASSSPSETTHKKGKKSRTENEMTAVGKSTTSTASNGDDNNENKSMPTPVPGNDGEHLSHGWSKVQDPVTRKKYYLNDLTLQTSWNKPNEDGTINVTSNAESLGW